MYYEIVEESVFVAFLNLATNLFFAPFGVFIKFETPWVLHNIKKLMGVYVRTFDTL